MDASRLNPRVRFRNLDASLQRLAREMAVTRRELRQSLEQIEHLTALVHSTASAASLRSRVPRRPYRVLFLVHHLGAWSSVRSLILAMQEDDDFAPTVATIPHRYPGDDDFGGEAALHERMLAEGVEHLRFDFDDSLRALPIIRAIDPDLVIRQSQWDNDVPDAFRTNALNFVRQGLVPYESMNLIVNPPVHDRRNTAVDEELHNAGWVVFATNEPMRRMAIEEGSRLGRNVDVIGHAKAHELREATPQWPVDTMSGRPRVVWSAHHSIGSNWSRFGTFGTIHARMLEWARQREDVEIVFMPHPALPAFVSTPESPVSTEDYAAFVREWSALPNTAVYDDADYMSVLAACDVVLTDGISMLIEPQVMSKPIVFLEREGHAPFNRLGELALTGVHRTADLAHAQELAVSLTTGDDELAERQRTNAAALFPAGDVARRALDALRARFAAEQPR